MFVVVNPAAAVGVVVAPAALDTVTGVVVVPAAVAVPICGSSGGPIYVLFDLVPRVYLFASVSDPLLANLILSYLM